MTAVEILPLAFELGAVVCLGLIAARLRRLHHLDAPRPLPQPTTDPTYTKDRPMSMSANERRRHGLALVRRTIASGKYSKRDIARWEDEFGAEAVQDLLPEDSKSATPSSSTSSKSKE